MTQVSKVLIVGPSWVGDMVMAQSLFKTLVSQCGHSIIDVLAPQWCHPLLARMPEVNEAVIQPVEHGELKISARFALAKQLRSNDYTRAIIVPRSFKAALVPFLAGVPQRTGYRGEMRFGLINDMRVLDKSKLTQTVQRYVALAAAKSMTQVPSIPYPKLRISEQNQQSLMASLNLVAENDVIGFVPGAEYGPAKRWPVEYFIALANQLIGAGKQVWVFGSQKDYEIGDAIGQALNEKYSKKLVNLCGKTTLVDVVDLIAMTDTLVTNDSGLMHIGAATGTRIVALYGSSTPAYTPPLTDHAQVIYKKLGCSPCFKRECPLDHTNCLKDISVDEVRHAVLDY